MPFWPCRRQRDSVSLIQWTERGVYGQAVDRDLGQDPAFTGKHSVRRYLVGQIQERSLSHPFFPPPKQIFPLESMLISLVGVAALSLGSTPIRSD